MTRSERVAVAAGALAATGLALACDAPGTAPAAARSATTASSVVCTPLGDGPRDCIYSDAGAQVRARDSSGVLTELAVWHDGRWRALPAFDGHASGFFSLCYLAQDSARVALPDRVTIRDFDGDGRHDVLVVAACERGIGPEPARPFPVASLYTQPAPGRYVTDAARDGGLTAALPDRCAEYACDGPAAVRQVLAPRSALGRP